MFLRLTQNYAFEIDLFRNLRDIADGITFFEFAINADFYKEDHNPKWSLMLIILNLKIIEIMIYNLNHVED